MYIDWKTDNENSEVLKFKREEEQNDLRFNNSYIEGLPAVTFPDQDEKKDSKKETTTTTDPSENSKTSNEGDEFNLFNITNGHNKQNPNEGEGHAPSKSTPLTNATKNSDKEKSEKDKSDNDSDKDEHVKNVDTSVESSENTKTTTNPYDRYKTIDGIGNNPNIKVNNNPSSVNYLTYILIGILILVSIGFFSVGVFVYHNKKSKRKQNLNNIKQSTLERIAQDPADVVFVPSVNPTPSSNYQEFASNPLNAEAFNSIPTIYVTTPHTDTDIYMEQKKFGYHTSKEEVEAYAKLESKVDVKNLKALEKSGRNSMAYLSNNGDGQLPSYSE